MSVDLSTLGGAAAQFFDNNGVILSGGKLYTYAAGTTTPKASYTSGSGNTPHSNPIILDSAGRVPGGEIWLTSGEAYKFVLETPTNILLGTWDNIYGYTTGSADASTEVQTATAGQTLFVLSSMAYNPGTSTLGVFIDGVNQVVGNSYIETSATSVTFVSGLHVGAVVKFVNLNIASTDANVVVYTPGFTGSVATTVQEKLQQYVSVKDFGAVGDGVADDTSAIQAAISYAATAIGGSIGMAVYFPTGTYLISETITLPNRVGLQGANGRGVTIKPHSTFADQYMFHANNGVISMFGSWLRDFQIDARGKNMTAVIWTQAWQETCGMERVTILLDGTTQYGVLYTDGFGGASYCKFSDCEIFTETTAVDGAGVYIEQVSLSGGFVFEWDGGSITGNVGFNLPHAIYAENDSLLIKLLHVEYVDNAVTIDGVGGLSADTITGSFNDTVNIVSLASTFTGDISLRNILPNGATGDIVQDNTPSARSISAGSTGTLPSYDRDFSGFSAGLTAQIPNVTGNGTEYLIVFNDQLYDYKNEYNPATGIFTPKRSGKYLLTTCVKILVTTAVTTCLIKISTSNREYAIFRGNTDSLRSGDNTITFNGAIIADMDALDAARVTITITGLGADTVDIEPNETFFQGQWLTR